MSLEASPGRLRWYLFIYSACVAVYLVLSLEHAVRSPATIGFVEIVYHAMSRTAAVGTALAAVIVGMEGTTMAFLKREREKGRSEGRREGRREMKEHDRQWREWRERVKTDPKAEPPPPPKEDD